MTTVADIQRALIARGENLAVDGDLGPLTLAAIMRAIDRLPLADHLPPVGGVTIDRAKFFAALRSNQSSMFGSSLTPGQVNGMEGLLDGFAATGDGRVETLAYGLATARREVGIGMVPVREGFKLTDASARAYVAKNYPNKSYSKPKPPHGFVYYGRGYVQLTHDTNYAREGILGDPDRALEPKFAAELMFKGLLDGRWNGQGKGIAFYLPTGGPYDLKNARRTVNVTDHWQEIAGYFNQFMAAIQGARA